MGVMYSLPISSMTAEELEEEKRRLTLQPRGGFNKAPPPHIAWYVQDEVFYCPRFYGFERFGDPEHDDRVDGDAIDLRFEGTLTEIQEKATQAVFSRHYSLGGIGGTMVCLPCGFGKTVWGIHTCARLGKKTVVLVHRAQIGKQWKQSFERFCPGVRVGFIQGKQFQVENYDVVIAMVLTIAKRQYDPAVFDSVGFVICDEAHHMAAAVMSRAIHSFRARHVLGLTATKDRPDGLTPVLHWNLGPEGFRAKRDCEPVNVTIALFQGGTKNIKNREGKPMVTAMINSLARHRGRNLFLVSRIVTMYHEGRMTIVLSDRTEQIRLLASLLTEAHIPDEDVGIFIGATKESDRDEQLSRRIVLCNYDMANEGLDRKELDSLVFALPRARVTQAVGRIQRPCETKKHPLVLDLVDHNVPFFEGLRWKRQKHYSEEKYNVQVLPANGTDPSEWFV